MKKSTKIIISMAVLVAIVGIIFGVSNIHRHKYIDEVVAPTCTEKGYTRHTCECGDTYTDSETEPLGHKYIDEVVAPTCTEKGYTKHTCELCGDTYTDSETEPLGHKYIDEVIAPTCTEKGYTKHTCEVCGDTYTDSETEALGHKYIDEVIAPTYTEKGYTKHTCEVCGDTYTDNETQPKPKPQDNNKGNNNGGEAWGSVRINPNTGEQEVLMPGIGWIRTGSASEDTSEEVELRSDGVIIGH